MSDESLRESCVVLQKSLDDLSQQCNILNQLFVGYEETLKKIDLIQDEAERTLEHIKFLGGAI